MVDMNSLDDFQSLLDSMRRDDRVINLSRFLRTVAAAPRSLASSAVGPLSIDGKEVNWDGLCAAPASEARKALSVDVEAAAVVSKFRFRT